MNANKWMEPLPRVFDILQYFETILPSEVCDLPKKMRYILWMVTLAWRPVTSATMVAISAAILDFTKN